MLGIRLKDGTKVYPMEFKGEVEHYVWGREFKWLLREGILRRITIGVED